MPCVSSMDGALEGRRRARCIQGIMHMAHGLCIIYIDIFPMVLRSLKPRADAKRWRLGTRLPRARVGCWVLPASPSSYFDPKREAVTSTFTVSIISS